MFLCYRQNYALLGKPTFWSEAVDKGLKEAYRETKTVLSFCVDKAKPVIYRTQGYMLFECRKKYQCSSVSLDGL